MEVDVIVVGSGFGGIGMAIEIERRKLGTYVVLERAASLGGTWRDNSYPGAACDVPSSFYSYSFAPSDWSRRYATHDEILAYLEKTAESFAVTSRVRYNETVQTMTWDETSERWQVVTSSGAQFVSRYVVDAIGQLSRPRGAGIQGESNFAGPQFHTAQWDHSLDLAGRRVGLFGTGASAIQVGPAIAETVGSLTVFQRSAPYIMDRHDPMIPNWLRAIHRWLPFVQYPARLKTYVIGEIASVALVGNTKLRAGLKKRWREYRDEVITDENLRALTTPDYVIGCKRVLFSSSWYPMLKKENVALVCAEVDHVDATGIVTKDGAHHDLDVLIWATGFETTSFTGEIVITGRGGVDIHEQWGRRPSAYRGVSVANFPNFFLLYGPNTNLGTNSIIFMLEAQIGYVAGLIRASNDLGGRPRSVDAQVERDFVADIDRRSASSSWTTSCSSWYTVDGVNTNNWPAGTWAYRRLLKDIDIQNYPAIS
jgi:cation diffusion facilitator CzcD-associated flavoprotein CzcO